MSQKIAVVTGGGGGIGRATSVRLAEAGYAVAVVDLELAKAELVVDDLIASGATAHPFACDVSSKAAVAGLVAAVVERLGGADALVNVAGMHIPGNVLDLEDGVFDRVIDVNLKGTYYVSRAFLPVLIDRGGGAIVNFSSVLAWTSMPGGQLPYATAKAGIVALTRELGTEAGPFGVRVNAVAPAAIDTDMYRLTIDDEAHAQLIEAVPLKRVAEPSEVASLVAFLVSDDASWITGDTVTVGGGLFAR